MSACRVVGAVAVLLATLLVSVSSHAASAQAAACRWDPTCPYSSVATISNTATTSLSGQLATAVAADGDTIVLEPNKDTLSAFTPSGELDWTETLPSDLYTPNSIAVDPTSGAIEIAGYPDCMYWFSSTGTYQTMSCQPMPAGETWSAYFPVSYQYATPGPNGTVYVSAYSGFDRSADGPDTWEIDELSSTGQLLKRYGPYSLSGLCNWTFAVDGSGDLWLPELDSIGEVGPDGKPITSIASGTSCPEVAIGGSTLYAESSASGGGMNIVPYDITTDSEEATIDVPSGIGAYRDVTPAVLPQFAVGPSAVTAVATNETVDRLNIDGTSAGTIGGTSPGDFTAIGAEEAANGAIDIFDFGATENDRIIQYATADSQPTVLADLSAQISAGDPLVFDTGTDAAGDLLIEAGVYNGVGGSAGLIGITPAGANITPIVLQCDACYSFAIAPGTGDIYAVDVNAGTIREFNPDGEQITSWSDVGGDTIAIDSSGNIWTGGGSTVAEYSADGAPLTSWSVDAAFEPAMVTQLALGHDGNVYVAATDGIRVYSPQGSLLAVWPYTTGSTNDQGGKVTVAANGDVVVTENAHTVAVYSGLLNPFPPVPPAADSPWATAISIAINQIPQAGPGGVAVNVNCEEPSGAAPASVYCTGSATLTEDTARSAMHRETGGRVHVTRLGTATLHLAARAHQRLRIPLTRAARDLLRRHHHIRAILTIRIRAGSGYKTVSRLVTLR